MSQEQVRRNVVPSGINRDVLTEENWQWRVAILAVFAVLFPLASAGNIVVTPISIALGVGLVWKVNGRWTYQWITGFAKDIPFRLINRGEVHKTTPQTSPSEEAIKPRPKPHYMVVTGGPTPTVVPSLISPCGVTYYFFLKPLVIPRSDPEWMDAERRDVWDTIQDAILNYFGQKKVTSITFLDWRLPANPVDAALRVRAELAAEFRPYATMSATELLALEEIPEQELSAEQRNDRDRRRIFVRELERYMMLEQKGIDDHHVVAITVSPGQALRTKRVPDSMTAQQYAETPLSEWSERLMALCRSRGFWCGPEKPLRFATLIQAVHRPDEANRLYWAESRQATEYQFDILSAPMLKETIDPSAVYGMGHGLVVDNSVFETRWFRRYYYDEFEPGEAAILRDAGEQTVAFVHHALQIKLTSRRGRQQVQQFSEYTDKAIKDDPNRMQSRTEEMQREADADELTRLAQSRSQFVPRHTRYVVIAIPLVDETLLREAERKYSDWLDTYAKTFPVVLSHERWVLLLNSLFGLHL